MKIIIFVLFLFLIGSESFHKTTKWGLFFFNLGNCQDGPKDAFIKFYDVQYKNERKKATEISGRFNISENFPPSLKVFIEAEKCRVRENLNTCINYFNLKVPYFCTIFLRLKNQGWSHAIQTLTPPLVCEKEKNSYYFNTSFTMDTSKSVLPAPLDRSFWKLKIQFYFEDILKASICYDIQVIPLN